MKQRIKNKLIKKSIIVMDINAIPEFMNIDEWYHGVKTFGLILYDSTNSENIPFVIPKGNTKAFKIKQV